MLEDVFAALEPDVDEAEELPVDEDCPDVENRTAGRCNTSAGFAFPVPL